MMMNSFDLGGCCLARYGVATSYFSSKTEQIMSRYRPIAPKPVTQSAAGLSDSVQNQQPQPCPASFRASSRTRKRNWDAASASGAVGLSPTPPPRPHKRASRVRATAPDVHFEGGHNRLEKNSAKSTVISAALRHSDTSEEAVSPHCEISDSAASKCFAYAVPPFGYSSSSAASSSSSFDSVFTQKENGSLDKDAAFMERAAASASPSVNLSLRKRNSPPVSSESMQSTAMVARDPSAAASGALDAQLVIIPEAERDDLVTLPLLPITPYRTESPSTSCLSNLSSRESNGMHTMYNDDGGHWMPELSLSGNSKMTLTAAPAPAPAPCPLLDISLLEHMYSASCDPVIVTDDSHSHQVVWYNNAYKRAAESALASLDLGIPKPLATFTLRKHHPALKLDNTCSVATLWGFAKKMFPVSQDKDMDMDSPAHWRKGVVIVPQALRPVGSSVLVECITDSNMQASPLCGAMEEIEEQFEAENWPALISDSNNRVRWANSAYKQMVGQPECSWLDSPATGGDVQFQSPKVMRINGEVILVFQRFQLPQSAVAFSCRVKIQWTNGTEKSSMTVPCDVVRSDAGDLKDCFYAWKFDVQAALCL